MRGRYEGFCLLLYRIDRRSKAPLTKAGIEIVERVAIPEELPPQDASDEIEAKKAAGYCAPGAKLGKVVLST